MAESKEVQDVFLKNFKQEIDKIANETLDDSVLLAYKLDPRDFYRIHIDDYIGGVGCIYYVNKDWILDWGGILNICPASQPETAIPVFPKFNRAVFVAHKSFRYPHFVSVVSPFAQSSRYTLISFNK